MKQPSPFREVASFVTVLAVILTAGSCGWSAAASGPVVEVSAWLPTTWDFENAWPSFVTNASRLACVSPVWYWLEPNGGVLARVTDGKSGEVVGPVEDDVRAVCWRSGTRLMPLISNSQPGRSFDPEMTSRVLNTPLLRTSHVRALVTLVTAHGYDGIEIDYELMKGGDRAAFTAFMTELSAALHARGKLLAGAFHPKVAEPGDDWGPSAQDWEALGKLVDSFRIMTYDHHYSGGPAGPLAALPWFKEVLAFAVARVPKEKILMGIPTYGYDWTGSRTGKATDVVPRTAPELAKKKGARIQRDPDSGEPHFSYLENTDEHFVWYEDAACLPAKLAAVRAAGVAGIAVWRLGSEEPAFWQALDAPAPDSR
ncbi:MAG: glycosyl hydrolase family 18 protein [Candidatus Coatesbacteria bacterium]